MEFRRSVLLCTAACLSSVVAFEARAEQPAQASAVQEVIVTAQRRSEKLQDVPLSVTALSADRLAAVQATTTLDLPMVTPGLRIEATGVFIQPAIRGITTTLSSAGTEANIATYLDGAYQQATLSSVYDLPDVESVEVLKGPQGTLFGRNATGGAILINTMKPDLTSIRGLASLSYSSWDTKLAKGFISVPIVDGKLAVSVTGMFERSAGYKHNLLDNDRRDGAGLKDYLIRGKVRFDPWEGADFVLTGLYSRREDNSALKQSNYLGNNVSKSIDPTLPVASKPWQYASDVSQYIQREQRSVTLHGDIEFGPGTFSTTSHYDRNPTWGHLDADNGTANHGDLMYPAYSRNLEQEFLYTTNQLGRFRAVGGLFYYNLLSETTLDVSNEAFVERYRDRDTAYAAFGEATYDVTDQLSVTGGLRWSHEHRSADASITGGTKVKPPYFRLGDHSWHAATPRVSVLYKVTEHTNVYGTFSKGFSSGTYNASGLQTTPVNPEHVQAFEVGIKSNEIANFRWSLAGFHYNYKDLQVTTISQDPVSHLIIQSQSNAARAKIYGAELNATWQATDNFDLTAGGTWLHARYASFPAATVQVPTGVGGNMPVPEDVSGKTMIRAPTFSGNLTAHYGMQTDAGKFDASGTVFYSTKVFQEFGNRIVQPGYALINATLGWTPHDSHLRVNVWAKNLTNKAVISSVIIGADYDSVDYLPPRSVGVELKYTY